MWKSKKFIVIAVLAAVVMVGSVAGIAFAQTGAASNASTNTTNPLFARVAQILGIDQAKLESAFTQARQEQRDAALDQYLSGLVTAGKITQQQADDYKAWLKARPETPAFGPGKNFGMRGFPGGKWGMMRGWHFQGVPPAPAPTQ